MHTFTSSNKRPLTNLDTIVWTLPSSIYCLFHNVFTCLRSELLLPTQIQSFRVGNITKLAISKFGKNGFFWLEKCRALENECLLTEHEINHSSIPAWPGQSYRLTCSLKILFLLCVDMRKCEKNFKTNLAIYLITLQREHFKFWLVRPLIELQNYVCSTSSLRIACQQ